MVQQTFRISFLNLSATFNNLRWLEFKQALEDKRVVINFNQAILSLNQNVYGIFRLNIKKSNKFKMEKGVK